MPGRDGTGPFGDSTQGRFLGRCLNSSNNLTVISQGLFCRRGQRRNVMTSIQKKATGKSIRDDQKQLNS